MDNATLSVKDVEDWAALEKRVGLEKVSRMEAESVVVLASAHEDAEGFVQKMDLLEGELAVERQVREVSEREHHEQFEELTLL
jgi:hypothetical protein